MKYCFIFRTIKNIVLVYWNVLYLFIILYLIFGLNTKYWLYMCAHCTNKGYFVLYYIITYIYFLFTNIFIIRYDIRTCSLFNFEVTSLNYCMCCTVIDKSPYGKSMSLCNISDIYSVFYHHQYNLTNVCQVNFSSLEISTLFSFFSTLVNYLYLLLFLIYFNYNF